MENLNCKLDGLNLKGINTASIVVDKTNNVGLFTIEQRHLTNAWFDTSRGYIEVNPIISLICVESHSGKRLELAAGVKMVESVQMVKYLIEKNFTFEELTEEVRKIRNYRAIFRSVENKLRFEDKLIAKGIDPKSIDEVAITANKEALMDTAKKIEVPKFYIPAEIPSYRKGDLDNNKKQMLKNIIKVRNLANALINELSKTSR